MNTEYKDVFNIVKQEKMRNYFLNILGPLGVVESYTRGSVISKDIIDYMYIVKKGRVNIALNASSGDEQLIYSLVPGEVLGEYEVLSSISQSYQLHFPENSEIYRIPSREIQENLGRNPENYHYFIHSMTRKYNISLYQVTYNRFYTCEERVIEFLLRIARMNYPDIEELVPIRNYTHEEIGNNVNLSRISVTNILKKLKCQGFISVQRKSILINSVTDLMDYRQKIRKE